MILLLQYNLVGKSNEDVLNAPVTIEEGKFYTVTALTSAAIFLSAPNFPQKSRGRTRRLFGLVCVHHVILKFQRTVQTDCGQRRDVSILGPYSRGSSFLPFPAIVRGGR